MSKSRFTIEVDTSGKTFTSGWGDVELACILNRVREYLLRDATCGPIYDEYGDCVGQWEWKK